MILAIHSFTATELEKIAYEIRKHLGQTTATLSNDEINVFLTTLFQYMKLNRHTKKSVSEAESQLLAQLEKWHLLNLHITPKDQTQKTNVAFWSDQARGEERAIQSGYMTIKALPIGKLTEYLSKTIENKLTELTHFGKKALPSPQAKSVWPHIRRLWVLVSTAMTTELAKAYSENKISIAVFVPSGLGFHDGRIFAATELPILARSLPLELFQKIQFSEIDPKKAQWRNHELITDIKGFRPPSNSECKLTHYIRYTQWSLAAQVSPKNEPEKENSLQRTNSVNDDDENQDESTLPRVLSLHSWR